LLDKNEHFSTGKKHVKGCCPVGVTSFYMFAARAVTLDYLDPHFMYNTNLYYMIMGGHMKGGKVGSVHGNSKIKKTGF
jgi:hypothetical protein